MLLLVALGAMGYALGSVSPGYLIGRRYGHVDLREVGSGSTGATNALRAVGVGAGLAVALADIAKGALAVWLAGVLVGTVGGQAAAALGAVGGHCWPIGLRGRGGRGMTPAVGATLLLVPQVAPIAAAAFLGGIALTRIVSVGSLAAVSLTVAGYLTLVALGTLPFSAAPLAFLCGTALIVFVRHADNIRRLLARREPRIGERPPRP